MDRILMVGWLVMTSLFLKADEPQALGAWKSGSFPFAFTYAGRNSADFVSTWKQTQETLPSEGGKIVRYLLSDPATGLRVTADVRTFHDYPGIDWVLKFTNTGTADTPIIENVQPLHWSVPSRPQPILHSAAGSSAGPNDFESTDHGLGSGQTVQLNSAGGRSSNNQLPFFRVQIGDHGFFGAIGWTGNWVAHFTCAADEKTLVMDAGMQQTHFLLHAGETVRTPRIVLLDWKGAPGEAQNLWRQFVLGYYSPRDLQGKTVTAPLAFGQGNDVALADELKTIQALHDKQVPIDDYWVDASWYGTGQGWQSDRGNWTPNLKLYPHGLKPLGDALKADGFGFILWIEAEAAEPGSTLLTQHPDWYLRKPDPNVQALLNLGNPAARQGMTDLISNLIATAGMTWYRQDFNVDPDGYWALNDAPDRVGITEMKDIAGLYQFWDDLRARHPGLQIDNCASGGRRLDIETISRSVALFRSDMACGPFDPISGQMQTQALNVWVPLNAGVYGGVAPGTPNEGASLIYAMRSGYSAGWLFGTDRLSIDVMAAAGREFKQVRPFFLGDFYPITPYSSDASFWTVWQLHRSDLKAGVILAFRRSGSPYPSIQTALRALDPNGSYEVEIRPGMEKSAPQPMTGRDLAKLQIAIPDRPGSALIFYQQK